MNKGVMFTDAEDIHAITKTAPGHATLASGSIPAIHGVVGNDWFDISDNRVIYNCEDSEHKNFQDDEIHGRSPKNLMVSTTADEIFLSTDGKSKIFGISVKDRGAVFLAGFSGKAFWFSKQSGKFTSSSYYFPSLPDWVNEWNELNLVDKYYSQGWNLLYDKSSYQYPDEEFNKYEFTKANLGNNFPHKFDALTKAKFFEYVPYTPVGDRLTLDFAEALIANENIGQDDIVDYLSISFSCTDYIGHLFGPNSIEYEDQILNMDKILSRLFTFIENKIRLNNTLIVLSSDHGVCESPEFLNDQKIPSGILGMDTLIQKTNNFGRESLKLDFDIAIKEVAPNIYFDTKKIARSHYTLQEMEEKAANLISSLPGIYKVYTSTELETR